MFRKVARRLAIVVPGEGTGTGVPFFGNIYAGGLNADDLNPPPHPYMKNKTDKVNLDDPYDTRGVKRGNPRGRKTRPRRDHLYKRQSIEDMPEVKEAMDRCPYFALTDMCVWHQMDPSYLDPGVLSQQEHILLLLYSRSYFDKWKIIHSRHNMWAPRLRKKVGSHKMLKRIFLGLGLDSVVLKRLVTDYWLDDSLLIAMNNDCWLTANIPEQLKGQLDCSCLTTAGVPQRIQDEFFGILDRMRTIKVVREDGEEKSAFWEKDGKAVVPYIHYKDVPTLFDFCNRLGVPAYTGQLAVRVREVVDNMDVSKEYTFIEEDPYFDYLYSNFYNPDWDAVFDARAMSTGLHPVRILPQLSASRMPEGREEEGGRALQDADGWGEMVY